MRDRVVQILKEYDEGEGYIKPLVKQHGLGWGTFRHVLEQHPELQSEYERIQHWRGEVYREKAIAIGTDMNSDPRCARVASETLEKAAASYNKRFNPRLTIEHDAGPNILSAMAEAQRRLPPRDLAQVIEGEYAAIPALNALDAANEQSADPVKPSSNAGTDDPFVD